MKLRKIIFTLAVVVVMGVMSIIPAAVSAATIGDCILTGYNYMGNEGAKISTYDGPDSQKDYFLAQPLKYIFENGSSDMWGYSWIKFDNLSETTVESAYLVLDLLGVGAMAIDDASVQYPATLDIYSPGDIDVEDLTGNSELRETLRNNLYHTETDEQTGETVDVFAEALMDTIVMTINGTYYIDITEIYNAWVTGEIENNGLVLVSTSENGSEYPFGKVGAKFASFNSEEGNAPYISTSCVPIPGTAWLLGGGLFGLIGLCRRYN